MTYTFQPFGFVASHWSPVVSPFFEQPTLPIVHAWDDDDDDLEDEDEETPEAEPDADGGVAPVVEVEEEQDPFQDFDENDFDDEFDDDFEEELEDDYEIEPDDSEMFPDAGDDSELGDDDLDVLD